MERFKSTKETLNIKEIYEKVLPFFSKYPLHLYIQISMHNQRGKTGLKDWKNAIAK